MLELALVRWVLEKLRGHGLRAGDPAGARARAGAVRDRLSARHRAADLLRFPRTSCTSSAPPRSRWPRCTPRRSSTAERLPLRYAGFSPCFRREAGAAGQGHARDLPRTPVRQGGDVQLRRARATPPSEHERILAIEEEILGELNLPYRVVNIAVTDLGNSAAKKYDCEAWLPSQARYRELTSCSNTTDYQARRLNIRVRREQAAQRRRLAHAQRHRRRGRPHARRAARERPAGRRHRRAAGVLSYGAPNGRLPGWASTSARRPRAGLTADSRSVVAAEQLYVIGLGRARERADQAEARERRLGHALDAGRVRGFAASVGIVGEAAHLDRVLRACGSRRCRSDAGAARSRACSGGRRAPAPRRRCSWCRAPGRSRIRPTASRCSCRSGRCRRTRRPRAASSLTAIFDSSSSSDCWCDSQRAQLGALAVTRADVLQLAIQQREVQLGDLVALHQHRARLARVTGLQSGRAVWPARSRPSALRRRCTVARRVLAARSSRRSSNRSIRSAKPCASQDDGHDVRLGATRRRRPPGRRALAGRCASWTCKRGEARVRADAAASAG